jgi:hypothetical protein
MPPARALWSGLYALITTLCTTIAAQYAQLAGTQTSIGKGAWIVAGAGALMAAAGAVKAAWPPEGPGVAPDRT